jgi:hypothetical protein
MKARVLLLAALSLPVFAHAGACDGADHRAFDFWIGDWDVTNATNDKHTHNLITREYDGCVIHEHYTGPKGYTGESLNVFDANRKVWHQTWVDSQGGLLALEGGMHEGKMVLEGVQTDKDGNKAKQRITWTPNADGSVRQLWESTKPDGSWSTSFDGLYRKK